MSEYIVRGLAENFFSLPGGYSKLFQELVRVFLEENNDLVEEIKSVISNHKRLLFKNLSSKKFSSITTIKYLLKEIKSRLNDFVTSHSFNDTLDGFEFEFKASDVAEEEDLLFKVATMKAENFVEVYKDSIHLTLGGAIRDAFLDEMDKEAYPEYDNQDLARKSLSSLPTKKKLISYTINDLIENKERQLDWSEVEYLKEHFSQKESLSIEVLDMVYMEFVSMHNLERASQHLGYQFDLASKEESDGDFFSLFLSSLRLSNLSNKRELKNIREEVCSKATGDSRLENNKGWRFTASDHFIMDCQQLTLSGFKRQDQVANVNSYVSTCARIAAFQEPGSKLSKILGISITDPIIAALIKGILRGEKLEELLLNIPTVITPQNGKLATLPVVKQFINELVGLTYTLFGCEVVRSPAALMHALMVIDLMQNGALNLNEALTQDQMVKYFESRGTSTEELKKYTAEDFNAGLHPSSRKTDGAPSTIDILRSIGTLFADYAPHSYLYDIRDEKAGKALEATYAMRSYELLKIWLDNILSSEQKSKFITQKDGFDVIREDCLKEFYSMMLMNLNRQTTGDLWYTGDQINQLLHHYLDNNDEVTIIAPTTLANTDVLRNNIRVAIDYNDTAVFPLNLNDNHWVGLVLRYNSGVLQAIYNDPFGTALSFRHRQILEALINQYLAEYNQNYDSKIEFNGIIDLRYRQQTNGYDCGAITVDNLVQLATTELLSTDTRDEVLEIAGLATRADSYMIRIDHAEVVDSILVGSEFTELSVVSEGSLTSRKIEETIDFLERFVSVVKLDSDNGVCSEASIDEESEDAETQEGTDEIEAGEYDTGKYGDGAYHGNRSDVDSYFIMSIAYADPLAANPQIIFEAKEKFGSDFVNFLFRLSERGSGDQILSFYQEGGIDAVADAIITQKLSLIAEDRKVQDTISIPNINKEEIIEKVDYIKSYMADNEDVAISGFAQYIINALSDNYFTQSAIEVISTLSNVFQQLETQLFIQDFTEDHQDNVALFLTITENIFEYIASGQSSVLPRPQPYHFDPDDYAHGGGYSSNDTSPSFKSYSINLIGDLNLTSEIYYQ